MANITYTRTKSVTLWNADGWTNITFDAITPPAGAQFVRWKIDSGVGTQVEQRSVEYNPFSRGSWYTNAAMIDCASNWNAPRFQARFTYSGGHVNAEFTLTVEFTPGENSITVNAGTGGSASASKSSALAGETITITCSPSTGYSANTPTASGISFTAAGTNKWTFTMPASAVTVSCTFSQINYSVGVSSSPAAGGTLTTNKSTAHYGDTVTLTKTPAAGYQFSSWTKTPSTLSINGSNQFTMPAQNVSVTANWTKINYSVGTSVSSGSGTLSTNKSTAQVGDTVTITASPSAGYSAGTPSASGITFAAAGTNKWTFTMPAGNVTVSISFSKITYTITKAVSPSGAGTVTAAATGQVGDQISVSQTPATGYYFNGWSFSPAGPSVSGGKFTMPAGNVTITANYLKRSTASLSSSSMTDGNVVTLTIVPDKTSYSHKYKLSFGTNMETSLVSVAAGTTSVQITIPSGASSSWARYLTNATQKTGGTLIVETYNGSTKIGEYTITGLTYNVPASAVPTIGTITTGIVRTVGGTTYANVGNVYVQGKCAVRTQVSGSGALGSSISSMSLTMSGYSAAAYKTTVSAASIDFTSGLLTIAGTCTITITATDSRGRTASKTATISVAAYNRPNGSLSVVRVDSGRNVNPLGTYATYTLTKSYTQVGSNTLSWSITSQNTTASSPANSGDLLPNNRQSFSQTQEYTIRLTLTDAFETVHIDVVLPTARFIFHFNGNGDRMGFMTAVNESLSKNGKDTVIQFAANGQIYIGNTTLEDYIRGVINGTIT